MLELRILGPLEVLADGRPIGLGGPRQRSLLAILVLRRGEAIASDRLAEELWNERPPATAAKTLQGYVSHLRKALGDGVLATRNGGYVLDVASEQVDAERFAALVADARAAGDPAAARELLAQGLALWRGPPLSDLAYEPFAQGAIARLEEAWLDALEDRVEADLALGRHRALTGELEALVAAHPERERLLAQLMLSLYRGGRQTEALEAYRRGRRALQEELGLEPGPELRALERQILEHDPRLKARPAPASRARRRGLLVTGVAVVLAAAITAGLAGRGHATAVRVQPNSLVAIDTDTNRIVGDVPVGGRPDGVAAAAGSLWVATLDDQTVVRVDPHTLRQSGLLSFGSPPTGIAAAGRRVWVALSGPTASSVVVRPIDPQFDAPGRPIPLDDAVPGGTGVLAARGSALYVAPGYGLLTTLDARGRPVHRSDPNATPAALAASPGAVWMTDGDAGDAIRVDSSDVPMPVPVGDAPSGIAYGAGAIWVAVGGEDRLLRIDPDTLAPTDTIRVGSQPAGVTFGAGSVWVANSGDGTVTRIDPRRRRVVRRIAVGGSPQAIAIADGRAWVTDDARTIPAAAGGRTLRFDAEAIDTMDPARTWDWHVDQLLYETCVKLFNYPDRRAPAGTQLVPEAAQSLSAPSAGGRTYGLTIRRGFRFSSGAPVTARTFKATIERTLDPRMHSPDAAELGGDIAGARAFMAGRSRHVSGVSVHGDRLTIRLVAPAGDFPARLAQPAFCAVPPGTPHRPHLARPIPMAGPYRIESYDPKQGVVLTRNPHYHGNRPRNFARIVYAVMKSGHRAVAQVARGEADVTDYVLPSQDARLHARYGTRYRVNAGPQLDYFALNARRPLFAHARVRQAVNYAINRRALDRLGDRWAPFPERETDHYIPPGFPGYRATHTYPPVPDLARARRLGRRWAGRTVALDVCREAPCAEQAQIVRTDLARIGLRVRVRTLPDGVLFGPREASGAGWDMVVGGWIPDYWDPSTMLNELFSSGREMPRLRDRAFQARLASVDRLSGTRRYLEYARLDADLARDAPPLVAFGNLLTREFLAARVGCPVESMYGLDLGALCRR